jgi:uncharacterized membrane protein
MTTNRTFAVTGLAGGCVKIMHAAADAALAVPGVRAVWIDPSAGMLTVTSAHLVDVDRLAHSVQEAGFELEQSGRGGRRQERTNTRHPIGRRDVLRSAWSKERSAARDARARGDAADEWRHLERAHVLSQPVASLHLRTHLAMLAAGFRRRDRHEVVGQLLRLIVAGPGSMTGRYPVGNTGGANVSALTPMPIPDDLVPFFVPTTTSEEPS